MDTSTLIKYLKNTLPEHIVPQVLAALRQDPLIWDSLHQSKLGDDYYRQISVKGEAQLPDWSPGRLALFALNQPYQSTDPIGEISNSHLEQVSRGYPDLIQDAEDLDFARAGSIALALVYRYRQCGDWSFLSTEVDHHPDFPWGTTLACLPGMLPDAQAMFFSLAAINPCSLRSRLAIHAILCHPGEVSVRIDTLVSVTHRQESHFPTRPLEFLDFLQDLNDLNSALAVAYCRKINAMPGIVSHLPVSQPFHQTDILRETANTLLSLEITRLAGDQVKHDLLLNKLESMRNLMGASLLSQVITQKPIDTQDILASSHLISKWKETTGMLQSVQPASICEPFKAGWARAMALTGKPEEACAFLSDRTASVSDDIFKLSTLMSAAQQAGEIDLAQQAGLQLTEVYTTQQPAFGYIAPHAALNPEQLASQLIDLGMQFEAIRILEYALYHAPYQEPWLIKLIDIQLSSCKHPQAASNLQILAGLHPDDLILQRKLAQTHEMYQNWEAALEEWVALIGKSTYSSQADELVDLHALAACSIKAGHPIPAIHASQRAISLDKDDSLAHTYLGQAYALQGNYERGRDYLTQATQMNPTMPEGWLALAAFFVQQDHLNQAIESLQTAKQIIPNNAQILSKLGEYHLKAGNPTLAVSALKQSVSLAPEQFQYHYLLGLALNNVGRTEEACNELGIAYRAQSDNRDFAHAYGAALLISGDPEAALNPLSFAVESQQIPNPTAYVDYARVVMELNYQGETSVSPEQALVAVEHALSIDPSLAEAKAWRAEALKGIGNIGAAFSAYQEALETHLTSDRAWRERLTFGMGSTAYQLGRYDIAIASAQEAISISPQKAENYKLLAVAYLYSNLFDDSLRAARTVLNLNLDDLANLTWYADHIARLVTKHNALASPNLQNQAKQALQEAQNALYQGAQMAPNRVDLSVKLSKLQQMAGDSASALVTINLVVKNEHATVEHLIAAAEQLQALGDMAGAVICLEKAVALDRSGNNRQSLDLLTRLADAYTKKGDLTSASNAYEQAISLAPDLGQFYQERTMLLIRLGRIEDAFACVETGISLARTDTYLSRLNILAAWLYRQSGDIASALVYIKKGMEVNDKILSVSPSTGSPLLLEDRILIADILRAALQPRQAYEVLKESPDVSLLLESALDTTRCSWLGLKTELELELDYTPSFESSDDEEALTNPPASWLALLARLTFRKGDINKAEHYYQSARQIAQDEASTNTAQLDIDLSKTQKLFISLLEASLDLNEWQYATEITGRLAETAPNEPFTHLAQARLIVNQAEFQRACDHLDVTQHAPGEQVVSDVQKGLLESTIQKASELVQRLEQNNSSFDISHPITRLERWHARGLIAFCTPPASQDSCLQLSSALACLRVSTSLHPQTPEEAAAVISAANLVVTQVEEQTVLANVLQVTRLHSRNPWVWFHAAIALENTNPREALSAARGALQLLPSQQCSLAMLDQALLARIAWQLKDLSSATVAIESALEVWPNEANWHVLAAQIHQEADHPEEGLKHLEQAAILEPASMTIQLELGKAYLADISLDPNNLNQALKCLETAVLLAPNEVSAWVWRARAQLRANQVDQASASVQQIIALNPGNAEVSVLQAEIALLKKSYQTAHYFAQSAVQARPEDPKTTLILAKTLKSLNQPAEALQVIESAIPGSQDPLSLQYERVKLLHELKGASAALQILSELVTKYPDDARILASLARSQADLGDIQAATHTALAATKAGQLGLEAEELAHTHYLAGSLLRKSGQLDQAVQYLSEAVNLSPNYLDAYLELGLARKERREFHQALQAFELASKIAPRDPRPHYQAGLALKEGKDFRRSEAMLRQAASLAPDDVLVRRQLAQVVALNLVHNPRT